MMEDKHGLSITDRDRVMRAWQNSMEAVRDFETFSSEVDDDKLSDVFSGFAEDECVHAARFLEILHDFEKKGVK